MLWNRLACDVQMNRLGCIGRRAALAARGGKAD